jgi:cell division protease FtsH
MRPNKDKQRRPLTPPEDPGLPSRPRIGRQLLLWAILVGSILIGFSLYKKVNRPVETVLSGGEFIVALNGGQFQSLQIRGDQVTARSKAGGGLVRTTLPPGVIDNNFEKWTAALNGQVEYKRDDSGIVPLLLVNVLPVLLILLVILYFLNRQMRAASARDSWVPFVGSSTQHARKERPSVTFDDVAGVEEAKEEVEEIIQFLRNPEKFQRIGGRIPRGVLLVGAPGTGKTLLAKAIAGEADAPFFSLCGSDFVELFVGVGAARVRDLFRQARQNAPSIIFLDEIDAVGRKRGTGLGGGHDEREQTLNAILSEMDGFSRDEGVIVIAATNRPDVLDPALLRPGRFDREIVVDMPDVKGREEILKVHTRKVALTGNIDLRRIARGTPGFTGADLEALVNEAAIRAAIKGQEVVRSSDLEEARDKVRFGREKKRSRVMSDADRRMTAYHEAGHAVVGKLHQDVEPLHKVTIIPRGVSLGMTMVLPEEDKYSLHKRECLGTITMQLAGRVAEEIYCGDISSGAANDIKLATDIARRMVTQWGMSEELGPISYAEEEHHVFLGDEITRGRNHSEQMSERIDQEVRTIVMQCYRTARSMCEEHADKLQALAAALLELETLTGEEVDRIFEGVSPSELAAGRAEQQAREEQQPAGPQPEGGEDAAAGGYPRPLGSPA